MSRNRKQKLRAIADQDRGDVASLTPFERKALGLAKCSLEEEEPHVNLKYYDSGFECFSDWEAVQLKAFSEFVRKLRENNWTGIYRSNGQVGHKTGIGYTPHKSAQLPNSPRLSNLSPEITFFEFRITGVARVHGFRVKEAFFLVWLDRHHRICPM